MKEITELWATLHSPEQMQFLSNLAHWIEGSIFSIIAILALIGRIGLAKSKKIEYAWTILILIAGIFLPFFMLLHHGFNMIGTSFRIVWNDPQQFQHLSMALLLFIAGLTKLLFLSGRLTNVFWNIVCPLGFFTIGLMFLMHSQHGTHDAVAWAATVHKYLGFVIILSSIFHIADITYNLKFKWLGISWVILLLIAGIFLFSYREPAGAYEKSVIQQEAKKHTH